MASKTQVLDKKTDLAKKQPSPFNIEVSY